MSDLHREVVPGRFFPTPADAAIGRRLVDLANRSSRRSFLSLVGRASAVLLGAGFLDIWMQESASAACLNTNGPFTFSTRFTCMCLEVTSDNSCPNCCSGFWTACITDNQDPAVCLVPCHANPPHVQHYVARLFDCCARCADKDDTNKAGCSNFGDDFCHSGGYCDEGGCGSFPDGWRVKCVVKECTNNKCGTIIQNCN
jgi:hypothetical protein